MLSSNINKSNEEFKKLLSIIVDHFVESISQSAENMKIYSVSLLAAVVLIIFINESTSEDSCEEYGGISGVVTKASGEVLTACCDDECPSCGTENCRNLLSTETGLPMGHIKCCSKGITRLQPHNTCGPFTNRKGKSANRKAPCVLPES